MRSPGVRLAIAGVAVAAAYIVVTMMTSGALLPVRPVYEGIQAPLPYSWVNPPDSRKTNNVPPTEGDGPLKLTPKGSEGGTISTDDGQAVITFFKGSFAFQAGQKQVHVHIKPLDPDKIGPPPSGLFYDGNAYDITAEYLPSHAKATVPAETCPLEQNPKICPTLVLRYPTSAEFLFHLDDGHWTKVPGASSVKASLQLFSDIAKLGSFVAVTKSAAPRGRAATNVGSIITIVAAVLAILAGLIGSRIRSRRLARAKTPNRKRPPPKKRR